MLRVVKAKLPASGQADRRQDSPVLLGGLVAADVPGFERLHRRLQVRAHQVELVPVVLPGMNRDLGRRKRENEPATTCVNRGKSQKAREERATRAGAPASKDD